ncbi:hypothetical protein GCM10027577_47730 [Spirosoma fluminis]
MKLFDSNLIIYSVSDKYRQLRLMITEPDAVVSVITKVEALGYHKLPADDKDYFETLFASVRMIPVTGAIIRQSNGTSKAAKNVARRLSDCSHCPAQWS